MMEILNEDAIHKYKDLLSLNSYGKGEGNKFMVHE